MGEEWGVVDEVKGSRGGGGWSISQDEGGGGEWVVCKKNSLSEILIY